MENKTSFKEQRIRKITHLYYSRPDVQKALFEFAQNREVSPRYFEGFGKRPDAFQYLGDVFAMVKKRATSFHCSEELWKDPMHIKTGMTEQQLNEQRIGWDLLIDIDSKYIDYSKIMARIIIEFLNFHGVKNIGCKFSGSKGFHLIVPWKAFPKEIYGIKTSDMFPEYPRIITRYIMEKIKSKVTREINELFYKGKYGEVSKYIKREAGVTKELLKKISPLQMNEAASGAIISDIKSIESDEESYTREVLPDLILVSPRHLFRMPYSLHEKTALASVVLDKKEIDNFELKDADPMKVKIKNFLPDAEDEEAKELVMQALDWHRADKIQRGESDEKITGKYADYKPIQLDEILEENFPPCIKRILEGLGDGKKRAVFVLINLFRSLGMEQEELEEKIREWNQKNEVPLKEGYIKSQLSWSYRRKPILPQNCKRFYRDMGVCTPDEFCAQIKNPVNYVIKKTLRGKKKKEGKKK